MFYEQLRQVDLGLKCHSSSSLKPQFDFDSSNRFLNVKVPMGFKHQVAAVEIQRYLRGHLARKQVRTKSKNKYKRDKQMQRLSRQDHNSYSSFLDQNLLKTPTINSLKDPQKNKIRVSKKLFQKVSQQLISVKSQSSLSFLNPVSDYQNKGKNNEIYMS